MSIQAIQLRNFRGFREAMLPLKPLTVLLGPNSSGKSSFAHPLAALSHCQRKYSGRRDASLTPQSPLEADEWPIDLGGYSDLVTRGSNDKVGVELLTTEGWVEFGFGLVPGGPDELWFSRFGYPRALGISATSHTREGSNSAVSSSQKLDERAIVNLGKGINVTLQPPNDTRLVLERINEQEWRHQGKLAFLGLDGLIPLNLQHESGTEVGFNWNVTSDIRSLLKGLTYLRASRKRPARGYARFRGEREWVGYAGERTASVLLNRIDQENFVLPPSVVETSRLEWRHQDTTLQTAVGQWLSHLGLANRIESRESARYGSEYIDVRVSLRSAISRDITEVGYGISQTLPVIVAGLLQKRDSIFVVDLPEAHLHPRPQGDLADFFCALAMDGIPSLVETHSELFFHRLRLRAAMEPELMNRIAVYFVDAPDDQGLCSLPRRIGLSFEEELKWPKGFLREGLESEIQISSARRAQRDHD